jgi:hypothetical protein
MDYRTAKAYGDSVLAQLGYGLIKDCSLSAFRHSPKLCASTRAASCSFHDSEIHRVVENGESDDSGSR